MVMDEILKEKTKGKFKNKEEKRKEEQNKRIEEATIVFKNAPMIESVHVTTRQPEPPRVLGTEIIAIKRMDFDQEEIIRDSLGQRWIKCRKCQQVLREDKAYQVETNANYGLCNECKN